MKTVKDEFHYASHCKFLLKMHIIFVCKFRKKLLQGKIKEDIKKHLYDAAKMKEFSIEIMESDIDHIHLIVDIKQTQTAKDIAHTLKQISTYRIWLDHASTLRNHFRKKRGFWTRSYFARSIGVVEEEVIRQYIEDQGKNG